MTDYNTQNYDNIFSTYDLALAAALLAKGFTVSSLEKTSYGKAMFLFARKLHLDETIQQYWSDSLTINPRTYFDSLKHLKTRIYQDE